MNYLGIAKDYLVWHYSMALSDIFHIWLNYIWFVNHLFSVPDVIKSLFAPFKRLQEAKVNLMLHPEEYFSNMVVNLIMRIVGTLLRTAIILMALLGFLTVLIGGVMFFVLWLALPALVAIFFVNSVTNLIA